MSLRLLIYLCSLRLLSQVGISLRSFGSVGSIGGLSRRLLDIDQPLKGLLGSITSKIVKGPLLSIGIRELT